MPVKSITSLDVCKMKVYTATPL